MKQRRPVRVMTKWRTLKWRVVHWHIVNWRTLRFLQLKIYRKAQRHGKRLFRLWNQNSGDWHWVQEDPMPIADLNKALWKASVPSLSFYYLLAMSAIISTLGLLANSSAVIIGAMIIAPLMGPLIGLAYAMVMGNRRLLRRSGLTLITGVAMNIVMAMAITYLLQLSTMGSEILARTHPTLLDLGVALAAGAAGSFAKSRNGIADALPGVAISVALVPPLSVVGIGLAMGEHQVSANASLLFLTNLMGIVFSSGVVLLSQRYGTLERAWKGLFASILALCLLGLPLGLSLRHLVLEAEVRRNLVTLIRRQTLTFSDKEIRSITVRQMRYQAGFNVELVVATDLDAITEKQVQLVQDFLQQELERPIALNIQIIPTKFLQAPVEN